MFNLALHAQQRCSDRQLGLRCSTPASLVNQFETYLRRYLHQPLACSQNMRIPQRPVHRSMRVECACWLFGLLVCSAVQATQARALQKIHATVPYSISGKQTVLGPDGAIGKYAIGGQVVVYHSLLTDKGDQIGHVAGHCHIVSQQGPRAWISVCTKHYDWLDGSTMTAHATEVIGPDNKTIKSRLVIAGGIGRWEGAHGEDANYVYDPASGNGSGKIVLYCLKGVC